MMKNEGERTQSALTLRIDLKLKKEFMEAASAENRPAAQVVRDFMASYVERKKRKEFEAEARRQSAIIANSAEEMQAAQWVEDAADREGWS